MRTIVAWAAEHARGFLLLLLEGLFFYSVSVCVCVCVCVCVRACVRACDLCVAIP